MSKNTFEDKLQKEEVSRTLCEGVRGISLYESEDQKNNLCVLLHGQMKLFLDRIEDMLIDHGIELPEFIFIKVFINGLTPSASMKHIIDRVLPWKKYIVARNDNFFYKNKKIFGELPEKHVNYFSDLWVSKTLDEDDKNEIWDFFDAFIAFGEEYKKKN